MDILKATPASATGAPGSIRNARRLYLTKLQTNTHNQTTPKTRDWNHQTKAFPRAVAIMKGIPAAAATIYEITNHTGNASSAVIAFPPKLSHAIMYRCASSTASPNCECPNLADGFNGSWQHLLIWQDQEVSHGPPPDAPAQEPQYQEWTGQNPRYGVDPRAACRGGRSCRPWPPGRRPRHWSERHPHRHTGRAALPFL